MARIPLQEMVVVNGVARLTQVSWTAMTGGASDDVARNDGASIFLARPTSAEFQTFAARAVPAMDSGRDVDLSLSDINFTTGDIAVMGPLKPRNFNVGLDVDLNALSSDVEGAAVQLNGGLSRTGAPFAVCCVMDSKTTLTGIDDVTPVTTSISNDGRSVLLVRVAGGANTGVRFSSLTESPDSVRVKDEDIHLGGVGDVALIGPFETENWGAAVTAQVIDYLPDEETLGTITPSNIIQIAVLPLGA